MIAYDAELVSDPYSSSDDEEDDDDASEVDQGFSTSSAGPSIAPPMPQLFSPIAPPMPRLFSPVAPPMPQLAPPIAPSMPQLFSPVAPPTPRLGPSIAPPMPQLISPVAPPIPQPDGERDPASRLPSLPPVRLIVDGQPGPQRPQHRWLLHQPHHPDRRLRAGSHPAAPPEAPAPD